jgi:hypothetical protein
MSPAHARAATVGFMIDLSTVIDTGKDDRKALAAGGKETISSLAEYKIPFTIVSKDSGLTEKQLSCNLETQFGLAIDPKAIVLPQTPFRNLALDFKNQPVLVIGDQGGKARQMALEYGFDHVITTRDIVEACPHMYGRPESISSQQHCTAPTTPPRKSCPTTDIQISAIFVWWPSDDWDLDIQIIMDLLMEQGRVGTPSSIPDQEILKLCPQLQPKLYVCLSETSSRSGRPVPLRNGKSWLDTLGDRWLADTGLKLRYTYSGLGCDMVTVHYADTVLDEANNQMNPESPPSFRTVYMIGGDIPFGASSDDYEVHWDREVRRRSICVDPEKSGNEVAVYEFHPLLRPWHVAGSLREAVEYALTEEYWDCIEKGLRPVFPRLGPNCVLPSPLG